jgi:hypothetical protein
MRALLLAAVLSCGGPEDVEPEAPRIVIPGKITPWLHVEGETLGDKVVMPTGVAFDERPDGWRVSCLGGATPRVEPGERGALRLHCGSPVGER